MLDRICRIGTRVSGSGFGVRMNGLGGNLIPLSNPYIYIYICIYLIYFLLPKQPPINP